MAKCTTCGKTIKVPEGWSVGPAVRRHYWAEHPERMERRRADRAAERALQPPAGGKSKRRDQPAGRGAASTKGGGAAGRKKGRAKGGGQSGAGRSGRNDRS